jgi:hypothetical protein
MNMLTLEEKLQRSRTGFEFAGALICAVAIAGLMPLLDGNSLQPVSRLTLIKCLLLALTCFIATFWLVQKYWVSPISHVPSWPVTALIGATVSVHFAGLFSLVGMWNYYLILVLSGLASLLAVVVMGFIYTVGFTVRLIQKEIWESKVVLD